ncbi:MAG TPA: Panacea domain-containing protein [Puia sp.]|nr:Panacea domain-containing protein [Puia sp.]
MGLSREGVTSDPRTVELVLYVAEKLSNQPTYGATLLNKALYLIDNIAFLKLERPISKLNYVKQDRGATPAPNQFLRLRDDLVRDNYLKEIKADFFGFAQMRYVPMRQPNINVFDKEEIVLIDQVLEMLATHNASTISDLSHRHVSWQVSENMDELPFYSFLLTSRPPNEFDLKWAQEEIRKFTDNKK